VINWRTIQKIYEIQIKINFTKSSRRHRVCVWRLGMEILLLAAIAFAIQILAHSLAGAANDLSHHHFPPPTTF
jgi:hypothetical protein